MENDRRHPSGDRTVCTVLRWVGGAPGLGGMTAEGQPALGQEMSSPSCRGSRLGGTRGKNVLWEPAWLQTLGSALHTEADVQRKPCSFWRASC